MTRFSCDGEVFSYGWYFDPSPATEGSLLAGAFLAPCSLDQAAPDLFAAANPSRPWPKQVRAGGGKYPLATTTHRSEATSETATSHQGRSHAPGPAGQNRSEL